MASVKINTEIIDLLLKRYTLRNGVPVWLVRAAGKREAFLCGTIPEFPGGEALCLTLAEGLSLMAELPSGTGTALPESEKRLGDLAAALEAYITPPPGSLNCTTTRDRGEPQPGL